MARARNLKPGFFKNEQLAECCFAARILFEGLWTLADKEGRLEDRPKRIKSDVLPYDDVDVDVLLDELSNKFDNNGKPAFILRYQVNGARYIQIMNFKKHNSPHIKEPPSVIPAAPVESTFMESTILAPVLHQSCTIQKQDKNNTSTVTVSLNLESPFIESPIPLTSLSSIPESQVVDKLDEEGNTGDQIPKSEQSIDFMGFWSAYPKRKRSDLAMTAWNTVVASGVCPGDLVRAAGKYAIKVAKEETVEEFIKMPHNFLGDGTYKEYIPFEARCPTCESYEDCQGRGWYTIEVEYLGNPKTETVTCPHKRTA